MTTMKLNDLTEIQILLVAEVAYDGGRTATESLYDIVEGFRPTSDEDGEPIDDLDPYETSREEIGDLERAGILGQDDDGMASGGYSSLTKAGAKLVTALAERLEARAEGYAERLDEAEGDDAALLFAALAHTREVARRLAGFHPAELDD
jgi:hypothetical protein